MARWSTLTRLAVLSLLALLLFACQEKKEGAPGPAPAPAPAPPHAERQNPDGSVDCGNQATVWRTNGAGEKADVDVVYWAEGECTAYFVPEGGATTGEPTPDARGTTTASHSFQEVQELKFHCRGDQGKGKCYYRLTKAVAHGKGSNASQGPTDTSLHCAKTGQPPAENTVVSVAPGNECEVTVRGTATHPNCTAKVVYKGQKMDARAEFTTYREVKRGQPGDQDLKLVCEGTGTGECRFRWRRDCREQ